MKWLQRILECIAFCGGAFVILSAGTLAFGFHQLRGGFVCALLGVAILVPNVVYMRVKTVGVLIAVILSAIFVYRFVTRDWMREFQFWTVWAGILLSRPLAFAAALIQERHQSNGKNTEQENA